MNEDYYIKDFGSELDSRWVNSIHLTHFGKPIDAEHHSRMERGDFSDDELVGKQIYERSLKHANEARLNLLGENEFYSTRGVIAELGRIGVELDGPGVTVARRWGKILAVPNHHRWLYPTFQFREGVLSPKVAEVRRVHADRSQAGSPSPWTELAFFSVPRKSLGGLALKDCIWTESLKRNVDRVIAEAEI